MREGALCNVLNSKKCFSTDLGLTEVPLAERLMSRALDLRVRGEIPDLLLFLAHPKTVALGLRDRRHGRPKDLLVSPRRLEEEGIMLTRSIRGGGITYHWPGQIVCYPIVTLDPGDRDVPAYVQKLEQVGLQTLRCFGVDADRRRDTASHIGLWVQGKKIVSMGVRVSRWVTSFGFALNLEGDHAASCYVRPCGLDGVELITLEEVLGKAPPRAWVIEVIVGAFVAVFGRTAEQMPDSFLNRICRPLEPIDEIITGSG